MNLNKLASAILRGTWLMEPRTAMGFLPLAERFLAGEKVNLFDAVKEDHYVTLENTSGKILKHVRADQYGDATNIFSDAPEGSILVIPVMGTMMADDYCGSPGMYTMSSWLLAAADADNITGIVLRINSGGGTVEGTAEFGNVITAVDQIKPVEAFIEGQCCSAALWAASCCRKITVSSHTVEIGSVGVACSFKDYTQANEKNGVKSLYFNADTSPDKNQDFYDAIAGNPGPLKENSLNPLDQIFMNTIKANRADKLVLTDRTDKEGKVIGQEPLTGKTYLAQKAIENGLIDGIGSMADVMQSVQASASSSNLLANTPKKNMNIFGSDFPKLNALKGKDASAITAEDIKGVNEELIAKGMGNIVVISAAHFAQAGTTADANANALTSINAALGEGKGKTTLAEAVTAVVADRDAEKALATKYGKQPGAMGTKVQPAADFEGGEQNADAEDKEDFMTSVDRELAAMNKKLNPSK